MVPYNICGFRISFLQILEAVLLLRCSREPPALWNVAEATPKKVGPALHFRSLPGIPDAFKASTPCNLLGTCAFGKKNYMGTWANVVAFFFAEPNI